jgi:hypothetical protein
MSLLDNLGLEPDPGMEAPDAPAAPAAAPAAPEGVTGSTTPPAAPAAPAAPAIPEVDDEIVVPEGAENPDAVRNAIAAERKAARDAYKRAREAEEKLAAITEAAMPIEDRIKAIEARATSAELEAKKLQVGMKHGLSLTFAQMLNGKDEGELETHAKSILAELHQAKPNPGINLGGGPNPAPATPADPKVAHNQWLLSHLGRRPGA